MNIYKVVVVSGGKDVVLDLERQKSMEVSVFFFLMVRRPPRSTQSRSSAASDVYKRQAHPRCRCGRQGRGARDPAGAGSRWGRRGHDLVGAP